MDVGYLYHPKTLEYTGAIDLDRDPLDRKLMLPKCCTTLAPNPAKENMVNIYNPAMKRWENMRDHRGQWFVIPETEAHEIIEDVVLNDIYDVSGTSPNDYDIELAKRIPYRYDPTNGVLTTRDGKRMVRDNPDTRCAGIPHKLLAYDEKLKCWALKSNISNMKKELIDQIKSIADDLSITMRYGEFEYQVDSKSISAMQEKLLSQHRANDTIDWVMANNEVRTISFETLRAVYTEYQNRKQKIFMYMQNLRQKIDSCESYSDIAEVYDDFLDHVRTNDKPQRIMDEARSIFNG